MHFDRFRALYKLPVVPQGLSVQCPLQCRAERSVEMEEWYRKLRFPEVVATNSVSEKSLFQVTGKKVVRTEVVPEVGCYYLPPIHG